MPICGFNAKDVKKVYTKKYFAKIVIAQYSIGELKQPKISKSAKK